ncbi:hypothetical protein E3O53_08940 [Cryobacterium sp. TMT2-18-3]|uniref:hypothetical protein n=1 Tax=unclassified Cryobacterium TaxID=2649013 RepID=UPI00106A3BAB|nr:MULTISPECIES: hypothetical protein [unclassified Cryobacterium]TFC26245.1 hypothetical protein E3O22_11360 [Cryobacterium sp. TMT2-18-2]TFC64576.1 hypothetical protein E3O53_08940 [Cryobacterium sp. TMT2-18-3]
MTERTVARVVRRFAHGMPPANGSAAVPWGLPTLAGWPPEVLSLTERTRGGRSTPGIRKHASGLDTRDIAVVNGLLVTSVERTVVDLAATLDLKSAVAMADRSIAVDRRGRILPLTTRARLLETWEGLLPFRGPCGRGP